MKKSELKRLVRETIDEAKGNRVHAKELKSDIRTATKALTSIKDKFSKIGFTEYGKEIGPMITKIDDLYKRWEKNAKGFGDKL